MAPGCPGVDDVVQVLLFLLVGPVDEQRGADVAGGEAVRDAFDPRKTYAGGEGA